MERIENLKAARRQEKEVIEKIKNTITEITDLCGLDEDKTVRRVQTALKSEYGRVNGLVNLLAAICKWPAEQGDGASVSANQHLIETTLNLDLMLLEDISKYKGYHTFATDELETIAGVEPDYDMYSDHCTILLEELGFDRQSAAIDAAKWAQQEKLAIQRTKDSITELQKALEDHKAILAK